MLKLKSHLAALAGGIILVGAVGLGAAAADDHGDPYEIPSAVREDIGETVPVRLYGEDVDYPTIAGLRLVDEDGDFVKNYYSWNRDATEGNPVSNPDGYAEVSELEAHIDAVCDNGQAGGGVSVLPDARLQPGGRRLTLKPAGKGLLAGFIIEARR